MRVADRHLVRHGLSEAPGRAREVWRRSRLRATFDNEAMLHAAACLPLLQIASAFRNPRHDKADRSQYRARALHCLHSILSTSLPMVLPDATSRAASANRSSG